MELKVNGYISKCNHSEMRTFTSLLKGGGGAKEKNQLYLLLTFNTLHAG